MRIAANSRDMERPSAVEMIIHARWSVGVIVAKGADWPGGTVMPSSAMELG